MDWGVGGGGGGSGDERGGGGVEPIEAEGFTAPEEESCGGDGCEEWLVLEGMEGGGGIGFDGEGLEVFGGIEL